MIQSILPTILLIALPLWALMLKKPISFSFGLISMVFAAIQLFTFVQMATLLTIADKMSATPNNADQMSGKAAQFQNVIFYGNVPVLGFIIMLIFAIFTSSLNKIGKLKYPELTQIFFWLLNITLVIQLNFFIIFAWLFPMPRRYTDYNLFIQNFEIASELSHIFLLGLCVALFVLCTVSLFSQRADL